MAVTLKMYFECPDILLPFPCLWHNVPPRDSKSSEGKIKRKTQCFKVEQNTHNGNVMVLALTTASTVETK